MVTPEGFLSIDLWAKHEAFYHRAFSRALYLLKSSLSVPTEEIDLNRQLYACLLKANRELDPEGTYPPPSVECCNQPDFDDSSRAERENKRPDFTWGFADPHEPDYLKSAKQFIIECKRIGDSRRPQWILNENYVEHGILRFVSPVWSYAQRFPSGMMVGYWQNMEWKQVFGEINVALLNHGLPILVLLNERQQIGPLNTLQHSFNRPFPVSPFRLDHLWVDLRSTPAVFKPSKKVTAPRRKKKQPRRAGK